jgi:hypothetical protein
MQLIIAIFTAFEVCDTAKKMGGIGSGYPARILTRR